jgi:hypothetical protein
MGVLVVSGGPTARAGRAAALRELAAVALIGAEPDGPAALQVELVGAGQRLPRATDLQPARCPRGLLRYTETAADRGTRIVAPDFAARPFAEQGCQIRGVGQEHGYPGAEAAATVEFPEDVGGRTDIGLVPTELARSEHGEETGLAQRCGALFGKTSEFLGSAGFCAQQRYEFPRDSDLLRNGRGNDSGFSVGGRVVFGRAQGPALLL